MSRLGTGSMVARAWRANAGSATAVALLSLVIAFVAVFTPQVGSALLTAGLRYDVEQATSVERDFTATFPGAPSSGPGSDPDSGSGSGSGSSSTSASTPLSPGDAGVWGAFDSDLADVRSRMPQALRRVTAPAQYATTTPALALDPFAGGLLQSQLALTASPSISAEIRYVDGRAPTPVGTDDPGAPIPMALTRASADAVRWKVGATHDVVAGDGSTFAATLTGVFVARGSSDDVWGHVQGVLTPRFLLARDGSRIPIATGVVAPSSFPRLVALPTDGYTSQPQTQAWFPVDAGAIDPATVDSVALAARHFTSIRYPLSSTDAGALPFSTELSTVVAASQGRLATASSVSNAVLVGPLGAAVALELLVARLALTRARAALDLIGARGASRGQLRLVILLLSALSSAPAAVVGGLVGVVAGALATGERAGSGPTLLGVAVAALVPVVVLGALLPRLVPRNRRFPFRTAGEAAVVGSTVVAAVVVAGRGITQAPPGAGFDPLSTALPLLIALTGCVAALRLLPVALAVVRRRARRRRGVSLTTGVALAQNAPAGLGAPLLAATVGVAVALFSSVLGTTLAEGLESAAHSSVGADVVADTGDLDFTTDLPFAKIPGVDGVAFVSDTQQVQVQIGSSTVLVETIVADPAALARVQRGVPNAIRLPSSLDRSGGQGVPVLVSGDLADRIGRATARIENGDRLDPVAVSRAPLDFLPGTKLWLAVSDRRSFDIGVNNDAPDQTLFSLDPHADAADVAARVQSLVGSGATVTTTAEVERRLSENPLVPGLRAIALEATILAGAFGVLALVIGTLLDTATRRRRISLLTLLGLSRRQRGRLIFAETTPLGIAALVAGLVVAAAMVALIFPSADLRSFTGASVPPGVRLDPVALPLLVVGAAVVILLISAVAVRLARPPWQGKARPTTAPGQEDAE